MLLFYVYFLTIAVRAQQPNCLNQITKFETVTFELNGVSIGVVDFQNRSCPSSKWSELYDQDRFEGGGESFSYIEALQEATSSSKVDIYNMINDALVRNFLPAIQSDRECNGIKEYMVEEIQWCTLKPGKSKKVNGKTYKANQGLIRKGERVSSYENLSVKISYFCNGNRRGFVAAFQFGGPSVKKCRDEVVFNGSTV